MDESYCPGCGTMGEGNPCLPDCERANEMDLNESELKVPYTYSLPQQFIEDKEVPTRWRVWAVINGFFLAGQYCWASNEWIAKQVKSHKDTVSQAVKELEEKKIIKCVRRARGRDIYPMIGANAYQWSASAPISDRHQRLSISYSNSVKENTTSLRSDSSLKVEEVLDENAPAKKQRDPNLEKAARYWMTKCDEEVGQAPTGGLVKVQAVIKRANQSVSFSQIKQMMNDWFEYESQEPHEMIQITRCLSPFRIDKYLAENV